MSDFDPIDLTVIPNSYLQRVIYAPVEVSEYLRQVQDTPWGNKYTDNFRLVGRRMLDLKGAKTVMAAIIPPKTGHLNSIHGWAFKNNRIMTLFAGFMESNVFDFFIKTEGKDNLYDDNTKYLPLFEDKYSDAIRVRTLRLNCITDYYAPLWEEVWSDSYLNDSWSISDLRLNNDYGSLGKKYDRSFAITSDYARRMALVELDVLCAMSLGLTLRQLKVLYRLAFFAAIQQEKDTWYDSNGRIIFTVNRALSGMGFDRKTWENGIKGAPAGQRFYQEITDDTIPNGPVKRTVEYIAPFDRCDRNQDYETAWKFFKEKYGKEE